MLNQHHGNVFYESSQFRAGIRAPAVGKVDDLHFLRWKEKNGAEVSNHFKYIANEFPVTLLFICVGLDACGLFGEGHSYSDAALAQTGRRTT